MAPKKDAIPGTAIATNPTNTALAERPAWLGDAGAEGTEHIGKDDVQLPRLIVPQAL